MLESALEQLLLQFLAPYVDGISKDKLHLGVFSGSLDLRDLKVKPDALALLGWEGLRVRSGSIKLIKLAVPWSKLYTGKVKASIECLHLEVENIADGSKQVSEALAEMRAAKQKAIEVRMDQLREQAEVVEDGDAATGQKKGYAVRLARKVLNNITVILSDVNISFLDSRRGLACGLEFPSLDVLSTDQTFREREEAEVVQNQGLSMYKLLRLRELGIRMSPAGSSALSKAEYVLSPISASLQLAHEPTNQLLRVRLEVATEAQAEVMLRRSQVKHLRSVQAEVMQEAQRLHELLVPPGDEKSISEDAAATLAEYGRLYERSLLQEWQLVGGGEDDVESPLQPWELKRKQLLEDGLSSRLLARERWKVRRKVEAVNEEVARRQTELENARLEETRRGRGGLLARFRGRKDTSDTSPAGAASASAAAGDTRMLITTEERDQLLHDLEDDSKVETVDLPARLCFEFVLGHMALLLTDDRRAEGDLQRQLLHLELKQANWKVDFNFATDHRGQDSAEWRTEIAVSSFSALHAQGALMKLHEGSVHGDSGDAWAARRADQECARLVVESLCQKEENLLKLCFDFMPVEVHMLPGIVELLLEFWRAPEISSSSPTPVAAAGASTPEQPPLPRGVSRDLKVEDRVEMAKQWLEAHEVTAKDVAEKVYDRIPDKVALEVRISSPILFVPVAGLGTSMISLGMLHIRTPQPCEYRSMDLDIELNNTALRADSLHGEHFEMVQPVPAQLSVEYRGSDEQNAVHCEIKVKELSLSLAPQAVQILFATPTSFFQILYPSEAPSGAGGAPATADAATGAPAAAGQAAGASAEDASPRVAHPSRLRRAAAVAGEVLGSDGGDLLQAVARRAEEVRSKQFKLDLTMDFEALSITMADSIQPFMRWRMELLPPGLILHQQKEPNLLTVNAGMGTVEVDVLNTRSGCWEPFLERCRMGLEIERKACTDPDDGNRAMHFIISGHEPVRVNLTPTAVRRAAWILPLFAQSLSSAPVPPAEDSAADDRGSGILGCEGVKYRVMSLCDETVELRFLSKHSSRLVLEVPPTGSSWRSLDELVLPHFATGVVAMLRGSPASETLPLERCGAVTIPGSGFVAELLAPDPSHRLLLLATPLRVHNQTDLPIRVRFHDAAQHEVLPLQLQSSTACDATLLGFPPPPLAVVRAHIQPSGSPRADTRESQNYVELKPNMCCAVPAVATVRAQGFGFRNAHVWISAKPAGVQVEFCPAVEVGAGQQACAASCRPLAEGADASARALHFLCDSDTISHPLPAPIDITTIAIRPALVVLNALPIGDLTLRYSRSNRSSGGGSSGGTYGGRQGVNPFYEAFVPRFTRLNIYDLAPKIRGEGVTIIARMEGEAAPWSSAASIGAEALFKGDAEATQPLPLRQRADGAPAGVTLEPIGCFQVRVACPAWFSDRSGLHGPLTLALTHKGRPLPHEAGLTLLHTEHTEEPCELVLRTSVPVPSRQGSGSGVAKEVRLPPSWDVLPWQTTFGSFVFCVQAEDVVAGDVLGAQCQVLTLRPRLVLTNASDCLLEFKLTEQHNSRQVFRIPPGVSVEHHWAVQSGQENSPECGLHFRPVRDPPCQWSGAFVCNDAAAGTVPFALAALRADASPGHRAAGVEVWSAEVAPFRGALSVKFKQSSDFVAVNFSERLDIVMALRPSGCDGTVADVSVPIGAEVPYGWMHPFKQQSGGVASGAARRAVEVVLHFTAAPQALERRFKIKDVRRTQRVVLRGYDLALVVSRVGARTLLTLVDQPRSAAVSPSPSATAPALSAFTMPQRQLSSSGNLAASGGGGSPNTAEAVSGGSTFKLDVKFSCLGISIVEEPFRELSAIPRDLLYLHLELIRLEYRRSADDQSLKFAISEAQVDCQLPGRADAQGSDKRRGDTLAIPQHERPAVIFANCADGDRAFLTVVLHRGATSSRDMVIPFMDIAIDAIDLTIDDGWLDPFVTWCRQVAQTSQGRGLPFSQVSRFAGKSVLEGYEPPPLPSVVQVESLHISPLCLTAWCALKLKSVSFLPAYLRNTLRVLSLSGNFTLDGAALRLEERRLPPHRGSLADFVRGLASEYNTNLLKATAGILGKSSVVNLPRVPLQIGMTGASYLADSVGLAAAEAASLVNLLTFDEDYVARQKQLRSEKRIQNVGDGLVEAGKSLAQGLEGMMDVWKKPMEGAKAEGLGGFFGGLGKGLAGSFVKPISKVGQAISDVGSGIAAQVGPDSASQKRRRARPRIRLPRLLFTELGVMRPWCELEAELLRQLGAELLHGVEEIVPLTPQPALRGSGSGQLVLLLFRRRLLLAEIKMPVDGKGDGQQSASSEPSGSHRRRQQSMAASVGSSQAGGSSSSSSLPPGNSSQSLDVFEALDESAIRLFSQALKPLNTVVYGVQDLEQKMMAGGKDGTDGSPGSQAQSAQLGRRAVRGEFSFKGLRGVEITRDGVLQLDEDVGRTLQLPLEAAPLGPAAREALAAGFRTAVAHPDALASWEQLRAALREERRQGVARPGDSGAAVGSRDSGRGGGDARGGAGQRVLEVFEVERLDVVTQAWRTPFMPLDSDLSWRWLDSSGCRHPHLNKKLTREQVAAQRSPPCGLDVNLFQPTSQWVVDVHAGTDAKGWRYGMAWNSSTWEPQPGLFDGIRKRRWTRTYA